MPRFDEQELRGEAAADTITALVTVCRDTESTRPITLIQEADVNAVHRFSRLKKG